MTVEGVRPWVDLPLWLPPEDVDMRGFFQVDASRAVHAGLRLRPLADTVRDTLEWARGRDDDELRTGLSREPGKLPMHPVRATASAALS